MCGDLRVRRGRGPSTGPGRRAGARKDHAGDGRAATPTPELMQRVGGRGLPTYVEPSPLARLCVGVSRRLIVVRPSLCGYWLGVFLSPFKAAVFVPASADGPARVPFRVPLRREKIRKQPATAATERKCQQEDLGNVGGDWKEGETQIRRIPASQPIPLYSQNSLAFQPIQVTKWAWVTFLGVISIIT